MQPMLTMALRAARSAGDIIMRSFDRLETIEISAKGANDFVTEVDKAAENAIINSLRKTYPDHTYIGEESGRLEGNGEDALYEWIIDPLDGTTNFVHGIPHFAISIACLHKGRIEHAVILDPVRREEFTASRGYGARVNDRRIRVSKTKQLSEALVATGFPFKPSQSQHMDAYLDMFKELAQQTTGLRRAGSAALDIAYVAAGRFDSFWEIGLNAWDIAAGALLVQEAGGLVSDFTGANDYLESGNIVCGNPKIFKATLQAIQPYLTDELKVKS
jgi:myo-inositol-1(or 4)-monophosphatase